MWFYPPIFGLLGSAVDLVTIGDKVTTWFQRRPARASAHRTDHPDPVVPILLPPGPIWSLMLTKKGLSILTTIVSWVFDRLRTIISLLPKQAEGPASRGFHIWSSKGGGGQRLLGFFLYRKRWHN